MASDDGATATTAGEGGSIQSNSIPSVDLSLLSQSQLLSLSLCSPPPSFGDDVVIPIIDRSVFNESAGSRKQTYSRLRLAPSSFSGPGLRRRTPHLRSFSSLNPASSHPDNARIVTILKQLFLSNATDPPRDAQLLVPVKLDYSTNSILTSDMTSIGLKRKRGRPRKDEIFKSMDIESNLQVSVVDIDGVDMRGNVAHGNNEMLIKNAVVGLPLTNGGDKEVLNKDGVAVDLVALGSVDHPFWDEIMRRTEGLKSEEDFLGFMKGLNGQWGSRRKKKRIVDASQFGNALPIGWKLLLSAKRKTGHVWLYCRRYISPSGRQFESCKEVSSYLLSLHGVEALPNDADRLTSASVGNLTPQNDSQKESLASHTSLPGSVFRSDGSIMKAPGDSLHCKKCDIIFNERVEFLQHKSSFHPKNRNKNTMSLTNGVIIKDGKYECQFCHKMFEERHRYNGHIGAHVRYQAKMAGEFPAGGMEESMDQVSFDELSVQDAAIDSDDMSETCNVSVDNGSNFPLHDEGTDDVGAVMGGNDEPTDAVMGGNDEPTDAVVGGNDEPTDAVVGGNDEPTDTVVGGNEEPTDAVVGGNDEPTDAVMGVNDEPTHAVMGGNDELTNAVMGGNDDSTDAVMGGNDEPTHVVMGGNDEPNEAVVGSNDETTDAVMSGNDEGIEVGICRNDQDIGPSNEGTDAVSEKGRCSVDAVFISSNGSKEFPKASDPPVYVNGSVTEIVADDHIQEKSVNLLPSEEKTNDVDGLTEKISIQDQDVPECSLLDSKNDTGTCNFVESNGQCYQTNNELKLDCKSFAVNESLFEFFEDHDEQVKAAGNINSQQHDINMLDPSNNEKLCGEEIVHSSVEKFTVDESSLGMLDKGAPEMVVADEDMRRHTEMQFGITSSTPSWNLEENLSRDYEFDEVSACLFKEPVVQNTYGTNDNSVCGRNMEVPEFDEVQNFGDGQLSNSFSKSQTVLNSNSATVPEQDRKLGVDIDFSSLTDKQYFKEDNNMFISELGKHKQEQRPGGILFGQSKVSDVGFNANVYPTTVNNQSRINESESSQNYGLSLSFDNFQTQLHHPASNRFEYPTTESYGMNKIYDDGRSVSNIHGDLNKIPSGMNKIYDDGTSVSNIHSDLRQGQHLGINFLDSSFNNSHNNKLAGSYNGGDWNGPNRGDNVGCNTMLGFGSNRSQPAERVVASGPWTSGHGDIFRSFDGAPSIPQVQGSSSFHNFDLMPDRGGKGGSSSRAYNSNNIGRNNNVVEYSFMEKQSSTNSRGGSNVNSQQQMFPYTNEQRLATPFWLGQQHNNSGVSNGNSNSNSNSNSNNNNNNNNNQGVPTACMWCGNMFYHQPTGRMQTGGAIGSMCPSCSSRMPAHFNLL